MYPAVGIFDQQAELVGVLRIQSGDWQLEAAGFIEFEFVPTVPRDLESLVPEDAVGIGPDKELGSMPVSTIMLFCPSPSMSAID